MGQQCALWSVGLKIVDYCVSDHLEGLDGMPCSDGVVDYCALYSRGELMKWNDCHWSDIYKMSDSPGTFSPNCAPGWATHIDRSPVAFDVVGVRRDDGCEECVYLLDENTGKIDVLKTKGFVDGDLFYLDASFSDWVVVHSMETNQASSLMYGKWRIIGMGSQKVMYMHCGQFEKMSTIIPKKPKEPVVDNNGKTIVNRSFEYTTKNIKLVED